jgi:glycolate oxidase FAD binding subunit
VGSIASVGITDPRSASAGVIASRSADDGIACDPIPLARPSSESEIAALMRFASRTSRTCLPIGCGSKLGWSGVPEHVDFALSTRELAGIVAYEPADGTLTARAGTTIDELAQATRRGGNHFTPDVARPGAATLGGTLAAGISGIDRTRYGPSRHHVLGMRVVLADGTIATSGGRLVKNVTGFDMHRLYCGSHGTLAVIVECSLRLFAGPESMALVSASFRTSLDALRAARSIEEAGGQPLAILIEHEAEEAREWVLRVALAGRREPVEWELDVARRILGADAIVRDDDARAALDALRDRMPPVDDRTALHIDTSPSKLADALDLVACAAHDEALELELFVQPTVACIDAASRGAHDTRIASISAIVQRLRAAELDVRVRNAPLDPAHAIDPVGDLGPGADWMRRLKRALDPNGVFPARGFQVGA